MPELSDDVSPGRHLPRRHEPTSRRWASSTSRSAARDLPEDLAHAIVEAVHASHDELVSGHAAAKETLPENVAKNSFLPFHPGAARYYREKGFTIPDELVGA